MATQRILVAEDELPIRKLLVHHLSRDGFTPVEAADGTAALRIARDGIDLILLDIGLPGIDGFDLTRMLRREGRQTPVLMLTARGDEVDRVVGLEIGADDYILKPFSAREVVARVRAVLRRSGQCEPGPEILRFGRLEVDEAAREARVDGNRIPLKPREYGLLWALASHAGVALSREMLLRRVWGYDFDGEERTVDVHIRRLRRALVDECGLDDCIETLHGYGYKFAPTVTNG